MPPRAPSTAAERAAWLVVADGDEILQDLVADVGPRLEYFLGRWPILIADFAGAEDSAAAPTSFDVFGALEQSGVFGALFVDATHLQRIGGDISSTAALWMAQHGEKAARDVDDLQVVLICCLQDRQIAV